MTLKLLPLVLSAALFAACSSGSDVSGYDAPAPNTDLAIEIVEALSADDMKGRQTGTDGAAQARAYIEKEIKESGAFDVTRTRPFSYKMEEDGPASMGVNVTAQIYGKSSGSGPLLILTAHYDHLGEKDSEVFNGADDNASGVAALFAIAETFQISPPEHDVLFIFFDAEEVGLQGARKFVDANAELLSRPAFVMNLDMISRNGDAEIYLAGGRHTPALMPLAQLAAEGTGADLKFGHDDPDDSANNWTYASDHGPFFAAGIPFAYFGVEDHPHYHKASDDFETLPLGSYRSFLKLLTNAAHIFDENLADIAKPASAN